MTEPPEGYYICPSCGTEFGNDDTLFSPDELRIRWFAKGAPWFSHATPMPMGWNPHAQLLRAILGYEMKTQSGGSKISMVDFGLRNIVVTARNSAFKAVVKTRLVVLGNPVSSLTAQSHAV